MYWQNSSFQAPKQHLFRINMIELSNELLVLIACKGSITAKKIAKEVVAQELGSSVRIISDVNSFFRWVGKVENAEEQLLLIKTTSDVSARLQKCIKRLHPP